MIVLEGASGVTFFNKRNSLSSQAHAIEQDVQKLRIVQDPKIHYDLLRFCQHMRLAFLARNVPPDVMMRPADVSFDPGRGDWGSGILQRSSAVPVPVLKKQMMFSYRAQLCTPFFNGV